MIKNNSSYIFENKKYIQIIFIYSFYQKYEFEKIFKEK